MVISELINKMENIKQKYGDIPILLMSRPAASEHGVISDAQDVALTGMVVSETDPNTSKKFPRRQIMVLISDMPLISDHEGTEEEVQRLLYGPVNLEPKQESPRFYIGIDDVVRSLLLETANYYVDYSTIQAFNDYVHNKWVHWEDSTFSGITLDTGEAAFERLAQIRNNLDLAGSRMYLISNPEYVRCIDDTKEGTKVHILVKSFLHYMQQKESLEES
ncbi:MAG: hypothetical protein NC548_55740 [Lachnospiraceae bacterium]|nr:hypothetical protein [Lachnospiraceae bacterium]